MNGLLAHQKSLFRVVLSTLLIVIGVVGYSTGALSAAGEFSAVPPLPKNSAPWVGTEINGSSCRGKRQAYGPYDYTRPDHRGASLRLVEGAHFMPRVNQLVEDRADSTVINDIDYTLRAFPNHHGALYAVTRYWFMPDSNKRVPNKRLETPPECYFQRAINFKPDDGTAIMLYGLYLHRLHRHDDALEQYKRAETLHESAQLSYNMGLLYFDMKKYEDSMVYAKKAYAQGYPLPGLSNKLKNKGYLK